MAQILAVRRVRRVAGLLGSLWICACSGEGGCGSDYTYPRTDPAAAPTPAAARLRITQHGLDKVAQGLPGVLETTCAGDGAPCRIEESADPAAPAAPKVKVAFFYLGSPDSPLAFNLDLGITTLSGKIRTGEPIPFDAKASIGARPYCDDIGGTTCTELVRRTQNATSPGEGFCRVPGSEGCNDPAKDYCCGNDAPGLCGASAPTVTSCNTARSSVGLDLASLAKSIKLKLIPAEEGGGIHVIIGCETNNCSDSTKFVRGSVDLTAVLGLGGTDYACRITDNVAHNAAFQLKSLRFKVQPHIDTNANGQPTLLMANEDVTVEAFDFDLFDVVEAAALDDPACYDAAGGLSDCEGSSACFNLPNAFVSVLFQGVMGESIGSAVALAVVGQISGTVLEGSGQLDMSSLIPAMSRAATPVGFLAGANTNSPSMTGNVGALGMNIDADVGFAVTPSPCVNTAAPPAWAPPEPPDPGATVMAPNPSTNLLERSLYSAALIISQSFLNRTTYALYNAGGLCFDLTAASVGELSSGAFTPSLGAIAIFAPDLAKLGTPETPVDVALVPSSPPEIAFGTGERQPDNTVDSHLKLTWSDVRVDLYPLLDGAPLRAIGFTFDAYVGITVVPRPNGSIQLTIDKLDITNFTEVYNELGAAFDLEGIDQLIGLFLPMLLTGEPIDIGLDSATLGIGVVPKLRAVQQLGFLGDYLGIFIELCTDADTADATNALCYEATRAGFGRDLAASLTLSPAASTGPAHAIAAGPLRVRAFADVAPRDELELAFRVDGLGPFFAFRGGADGVFTVDHPGLWWPGRHRIEAVARDRRDPARWTAPALLTVVVDREAPALVLTAVAGGVAIDAWDDVSPSAALTLRGFVHGPLGTRELGPEVDRRFIAAAPGERVTVWARDEAGLESEPRSLLMPLPASAVPEVSGEASAEREPHDAAAPLGCDAGAGGSVTLLAALVVCLRRRRR